MVTAWQDSEDTNQLSVSAVVPLLNLANFFENLWEQTEHSVNSESSLMRLWRYQKIEAVAIYL